MLKWTREQDAELTQLWAGGLSTSEIGGAMGVTKNAVIGRAHRLDLPPRGQPAGLRKPAAEVSGEMKSRAVNHLRRGVSIPIIMRETGMSEYQLARLKRSLGVRIMTEPVKAAPVKTAEPVIRPVILPGPAVAPTAAPTTVPVPARTGPMPHAQCQWFDGHRGAFRQCEAPAILAHEGRVWCEAHRKRVYVLAADKAAA